MPSAPFKPSGPAWQGPALYGAAAACVLPAYFLSFPLPDFGGRLAGIGLAILLVAGWTAFGWIIARGLASRLGYRAWSAEPFLVRLGLSLFLGQGAFELLVFLAAWSPGPMSAKFAAIGLLLIAAAAIAGREIGCELSGLAGNEAPFTLGEKAALAVGVAGAALAFAFSFTPPTYYDALVYHLALPSLYSQWGRIRPVPFNLYSAFPAASEMPFLFAFRVLPRAEDVINLCGWATSFGGALLAAQWAAEIRGRRAGWFTFALWWTMPALVLLSTGGYIDVPLAAFTLAAVRSFDKSRRDEHPAYWLSFAGLFCGFAVATKYTGAVTPILLGLALACSMIRSRRPTLGSTALFFVACCIAPLPWFFKNALHFGNPVFPFLYRTLGGNVGWTRETATGYFSVLTEYSHKNHLLVALLRSPWGIATSGIAYGGGFDVLGNMGWSLPLLLLPAALAERRSRTVRFLLAYFIAHYIFWFVTKPVLRFFLSAAPVLLILAGVGLDRIASAGRIGRSVAAAVAVLFFFSNIQLIAAVAGPLDLLAVPVGLSKPVDYLRRKLAFQPAYDFLNSHPDSGRVLLLGEQRTYRLRVAFASSNYFAPSPASRLFNDSADLDRVRAALRDEGISRVFVNAPEMQRLGGAEAFGFSREGADRLDRFLAESGPPIFEENGCAVYAIDEAGRSFNTSSPVDSRSPAP